MVALDGCGKTTGIHGWPYLLQLPGIETNAFEITKERAMGFEPTTFSLARRRSTTELHPQNSPTSCPKSLSSTSLFEGKPEMSL
jgi:hypothetical protein